MENIPFRELPAIDRSDIVCSEEDSARRVFHNRKYGFTLCRYCYDTIRTSSLKSHLRSAAHIGLASKVAESYETSQVNEVVVLNGLN